MGKDVLSKSFYILLTLGLYGVGKAADHPPALAILSHTPQGSDSSENIAWVGKGIVYDTGGLSIKGKVRKHQKMYLKLSIGWYLSFLLKF